MTTASDRAHEFCLTCIWYALAFLVISSALSLGVRLALFLALS